VRKHAKRVSTDVIISNAGSDHSSAPTESTRRYLCVCKARPESSTSSGDLTGQFKSNALSLCSTASTRTYPRGLLPSGATPIGSAAAHPIVKLHGSLREQKRRLHSKTFTFFCSKTFNFSGLNGPIEGKLCPPQSTYCRVSGYYLVDCPDRVRRECISGCYVFDVKIRPAVPTCWAWQPHLLRSTSKLPRQRREEKSRRTRWVPYRSLEFDSIRPPRPESSYPALYQVRARGLELEVANDVLPKSS